jgi:hypothetical protein
MEIVDLIHLVQDKDQWLAVVNGVMNLRFHKMLGIPWLAEQLVTSREGFSSMELSS